jgi:hypothetical protein
MNDRLRGKEKMAMYAERSVCNDADLHLLGERARWGRVGYAGRAFAPDRRTYRWMNATRVRLTTVSDSGRFSDRRSLANLYPLAAAALYEIAFSHEFGYLATWRN